MRISWIGLELGGTNYSHVGLNLAIPIPKFCHAVPVALDLAALGPVLIIPRLFILETWMEIVRMMHLL